MTVVEIFEIYFVVLLSKYLNTLIQGYFSDQDWYPLYDACSGWPTIKI